MDGLAIIFGRQMRALRKSRGLTQEQLGRLAKLDYKHIGSIERGEKTPSFEAVERIAKAMNVEFYQLFLPDRLAAGLLQQRLRDLTTRLSSMNRLGLEQFCRETFNALQKLDKNRLR